MVFAEVNSGSYWAKWSQVKAQLNNPTLFLFTCGRRVILGVFKESQLKKVDNTIMGNRQVDQQVERILRLGQVGLS